MEAFPDTFQWGATLHSHCVEGEHFDSDWWRWEQRPGNIADESNSERAVDHWNRFIDDVKLASTYGMNSLFITLEWSRIHTAVDIFDDKAIAHYRDVLKTCQTHGITPVCAMHHITLPQWIAAKGGWLNAHCADWFRTYVKRVIETLGEFCHQWIPIHEPMHALVEGYQQGHWPPEKKSPFALHRATRHQITAHQYAYARIKEHNSEASVGWSTRATTYIPRNPYSAWDTRVALREAKRNNHRMLSRLLNNRSSAPVDFIGLSYFGQRTVSMKWRSPQSSFVRYSVRKTTVPELSPCPEGLAALLDDYTQYRLPILITGNGYPQGTDEDQCSYLIDHVDVVQRALDDGIDVRGYMYHALLNGFEWDYGFTRRYGLMVVDHERLTRTPNSVALLYKELCETGAMRPGTIAAFCPNRAREMAS